MLKAAFAFGIMNCIFFAITAFFLLFMYRAEKEVVVKETYRRSSHGSRYVDTYARESCQRMLR